MLGLCGEVAGKFEIAFDIVDWAAEVRHDFWVGVHLGKWRPVMVGEMAQFQARRLNHFGFPLDPSHLR
ncbi:hypothetical protein [Rhizobium sp. PEPV16]|uniref:hypothetical protein n=1 Tax=Rhizobium sp. PEPV16 TaxID=1820614 RepID=UPI001FEFA7D0|nr:hypothetical protein [Rhizobium sp. PEPV16]